MSKICISKNTIIIIFLLILIIIYFQSIRQNNEQSIRQNNEQSIRQNIKTTLDNEQNIKTILDNEQNIKTILDNEILEYEYNKIRDKKVLNDDFTAPERRDNINYIFLEKKNHSINLPTRGYPDNYQLIGLLLRNNTENGFNLFGRQKFRGSNQYEYYAVGKLDNTDIKIPIYIKGDKEILDGDEIYIDGTNSEKGPFKVKLYNYETYKYNPYLY